MQLIEIALAPARRRKTQPGDKSEQEGDNDQRDPVDVMHDMSSIDML